MHVLYVHQNFPAQFGHVAERLARRPGWKCTFVSRTADGRREGIERIPYRLRGGATAQNHFCSRTFENAVWHCDGVYEALKARPDVRPDLVVAHSAFGKVKNTARDLADVLPRQSCQGGVQLVCLDLDTVDQKKRLHASANAANVVRVSAIGAWDDLKP